MSERPRPDQPTESTGVVLTRLPWSERVFIGDALRQESVGGALLLLAALAALVWANSPWRDSYYALREFRIGPEALNLNLTLGTWAADGLLAVFFFVAGLELKRELVVGSLRKPAEAALPMVAALCGMALPALLFVAVTAREPSVQIGWGIPMATDIAFALAVLAVVGSGLPTSLRAFLLTLAVVDDLGAILVIAIFYTDALQWKWLLASLIPLGLYRFVQMRGVTSFWINAPLALLAWGFIHESGVHATVAGIVVGLLTPVRRKPDEEYCAAERFEHQVRPWSAAVCVPIFAFFAAGVTIVGTSIAQAANDPLTQGVVVGLVVGKFVGVLGGAYLVVRFTRARLNPDLSWADISAVSLLAGVGFTVSLLIAELAFEDVPTSLDHAKLGILAASLIAAVLASLLLLRRNAVYRRIDEQESIDSDGDGIPDVYQSGTSERP